MDTKGKKRQKAECVKAESGNCHILLDFTNSRPEVCFFQLAAESERSVHAAAEVLVAATAGSA
jgi:hypothetical protein